MELQLTMSKREISSTLKNLKFMQRASQTEIKTSNNNKEENVTPDEDLPSTKRCVVIVEGDPHPRAARGRMSFLSFNPSIDKLNVEESDPSITAFSAVDSGGQSETTTTSPYVDYLEGKASSSDPCALKRKQAEVALESPYLTKSKKNKHDSSPSSSRSSHNQGAREN